MRNERSVHKRQEKEGAIEEDGRRREGGRVKKGTWCVEVGQTGYR